MHERRPKHARSAQHLHISARAAEHHKPAARSMSELQKAAPGHSELPQLLQSRGVRTMQRAGDSVYGRNIAREGLLGRYLGSMEVGAEIWIMGTRRRNASRLPLKASCSLVFFNLRVCTI